MIPVERCLVKQMSILPPALTVWVPDLHYRGYDPLFMLFSLSGDCEGGFERLTDSDLVDVTALRGVSRMTRVAQSQSSGRHLRTLHGVVLPCNRVSCALIDWGIQLRTGLARPIWGLLVSPFALFN